MIQHVRQIISVSGRGGNLADESPPLRKGDWEDFAPTQVTPTLNDLRVSWSIPVAWLGCAGPPVPIAAEGHGSVVVCAQQRFDGACFDEQRA